MLNTYHANLNNQRHTPNVTRPCDGLEHSCDGIGRYVVTLDGPNYERTPTYITMTLCEACKATWDSWREDAK